MKYLCVPGGTDLMRDDTADMTVGETPQVAVLEHTRFFDRAPSYDIYEVSDAPVHTVRATVILEEVAVVQVE